MIAWVFAALHPELLDALVIVNAPHPAIFGKLLAGDPAQQLASAYMLMLRSPIAEATLRASSFAWLTSTVLEGGIKAGTITEADRQAYIDAWSQPGALTGGLNYYRAARIGPGQGGAAASIATTATAGAPLIVRVPTLVIWGEQDPALITRNLDGLDALVPNLTVRRIADGTHWVVREQPVLVNQLIREFLAQR